MGDSILKQQEIAAYLGNLLSRIRKIEKKLRNDSNTKLNSNSEATQDGNPFINPYVFIPCEVTSIVDDSTVIGKEVFPDASTATPWVIASTNNQPAIEITVPANVTLPAEGDTVLAHFTGTFGTSPPTPRYGLFGAGGGGAVIQTQITSIGDDHLVCVSLIGTIVGTTDILVAKNYLNRRTPFDGNTVGNYSYVNSTAVDRVVTIVSSVGFKEIQTIIPRYSVGDLVYATETTGQVMEVTVAGSPVVVTKVDINADCREFVRVGFVA